MLILNKVPRESCGEGGLAGKFFGIGHFDDLPMDVRYESGA